MIISCHWAHGGQKRIAFAFSLLLLLLLPRASHAQTETTVSRWSLQAALGNQTIGFPFQNSFAALNPALSDLGIHFRLNKHPKHALSLGIANTWLFNESTGNAGIVHLDLSYTYTHASGVFGSLGLDIGSGFLSHNQESFTYNSETQGYETSPNRNGAGYSGFQLSMGYDVAHLPFAFFIRNKFGILSPYFPSESFPILPQNILELGLIFKFKKRSPNAD